MRVSAVIPNKNGAGMIGECVEAALASDAAEVIVVDDSSSDGSAAEAAAAGATVLGSPGRGFAAAVNAGVESANGDVLVILNSDCFVRPDTFGRLAAVLAEDPGIGICAAALLERDGTIGKSIAPGLTLGLALKTTVGLNALTPRRPGSGVEETECVPLACAAIRRTVWDEAAGLDERFFFYFEDQDICRRLRENRRRITVDWNAFALHVGGASSLARDEQRWFLQYVRSRTQYLHKHYPRSWPLFAVAWIPTSLIRALVWRLRRGPASRQWARAWWSAAWAGARG